jgi:murein DD-endopeptidase MepM/ murein hydrolase activator NlpD
MRYNARMRLFFATFCTILIIAVGVMGAFNGMGMRAASAATSSEIDTLNAQIKSEKDKAKDLDSLIQATQSNIKKHEGDVQNLENEIALLDNQIIEKQLDVQRTQNEIDTVTLEVDLATKQIEMHEERIVKEKDLVSSLIKRMNQEDETTPLDVLLDNGTLSDAFARFEEVRKISRDLEMTLEKVKDEKTSLEAEKQKKVEEQTALEDAKQSLKQQTLELESQRNFKTSLVSETQNKEQEFQRILYELRQQSQSTSGEISELETRLKQQLQSVDEVLSRGNTTLSWPVDPSRGITAIFHDPTYPFRAVFEHPGEDVRAGVGTPVRAAAGGYVAWTKTGRMYGNYIMIVHSGGLATVYGHLSKFVAKPDTFVERGEIIGMSGGMPGQQGAGLSTGPHLHFEVRSDGIPVDPEHYLPDFPNSFYDSYQEYKALKIRL